MSHRGRTHAAMMKGASNETIKNRKQKLFERMNRLIDNSSLSGSEKVFLKGNLKSIAQELVDIEYWRHQK
ncbi:hypothetical protein [Escherichia phage REP10]|uniref:Uncharacterized protein n=1 Tax=Escherichia phage REP8 TaxID=3022461 RepID=A0AAE9WMU0_9CAUD|nr:hypothetical protein [Escherichia phage REP8]WBY53820.1 hypothetical protein [Escherichia phage REP9]WBY53994.1 hypothetical protein [Escherichia phage REP10]WBY54123.1 hypothetical protein [Escherichia phage REP11]WBY54228.1 hypothetical protein [Escherichia phage REP12]